MKFTYRTKGTCSSQISFELSEDNSVHNISFIGGCNGNLKAISKLCEGMQASKIIEILQGNTCGMKNTSCGDQFAQALKTAINE